METPPAHDDVTAAAAQGPPAPALHRVRCGPRRCWNSPTKYGVHLPEALTGGEPPQLRATDERGWFRFQRLYDIARSCLREPEDIRRLVREAAEEDVRDGSRWLEIQVDPTSYAPRLGGLIPALEIILDAVDRRVPGDRARHAGAGRGEPHEASAGRPHAGPARRAVRGPGRRRLRALQRRTPRHGPRLRPRLRHRPGRRAAGGAARRRAVRARPASGTAWTTCAPPGSATAYGPPRTRGCWPGSPSAGSPARSARLERGARRLREARGRTPADPVRRRACRWRSARTTRCCSAPGWPRSTSSPARHHGFTDEELAELARQSVRGVGRTGRRAGGAAGWRSTRGWRRERGGGARPRARR